MIINIKTKPNSSQPKLEKISDNEYKAYIKSPPENNKANIELINLLSREFKIPVSNIKIKNPKSKNKVIEIITKH